MSTAIEWADETWNPITGCSPISAGCEHCYAARMANRLRGRCGYPQDDPFRVTFHPDRLDRPLKWRKPRNVFVCSMGDLFHEDVKDEWLHKVFRAMLAYDHHRFLLLTKRPERMAYWAEWLRDSPNIYPGVTVERSDYRHRINTLLRIPTVGHWVSLEPLLGDIDVSPWLPVAGELSAHEGRSGLSGVVVGGETGPGARPMHPGWVRRIRDDCVDAGVDFTFKSWGEFYPAADIPELREDEWSPEYKKFGRLPYRYVTPEGLVDGVARYGSVRMICVGKHRSGRDLDGRTWDEFPERPDQSSKNGS